MKKIKACKKIIYLSNNKVGLVVFNEIEGNKNILFASQLPSTEDNLTAVLRELLTKAANWLNVTIREATLLFADEEIKNISYDNFACADCSNLEAVTKEIFKKAKVDNYFVNDIYFTRTNFNETLKTANVDCKISVSNYATFRKFLKVTQMCNVNITNSANINTLLNNKDNQTILNFKDESVSVNNYVDGKLVNITNLPIDYKLIKQELASAFNISIDNVDKLARIAKNLNIKDNKEINFGINFDLSTRKIETINAIAFVNAYQDLILEQITNVIGIDQNNTFVITNNKLNEFALFNKMEDALAGMYNINQEMSLALANINKLDNKFTHYIFEKSLINVSLRNILLA